MEQRDLFDEFVVEAKRFAAEEQVSASDKWRGALMASIRQSAPELQARNEAARFGMRLAASAIALVLAIQTIGNASGLYARAHEAELEQRISFNL